MALVQEFQGEHHRLLDQETGEFTYWATMEQPAYMNGVVGHSDYFGNNCGICTPAEFVELIASKKAEYRSLFLEDNKYEIRVYESGKIEVYRFGKAWDECVGSQLFYLLALELAKEQQKPSPEVAWSRGYLAHEEDKKALRKYISTTNTNHLAPWPAPAPTMNPYIKG